MVKPEVTSLSSFGSFCLFVFLFIFCFYNIKLAIFWGVARIFQKGGGGGHTVSNNIVMAFSPRNIVGCLLKKSLTKGGLRAPSVPPCPSYAIAIYRHFLVAFNETVIPLTLGGYEIIIANSAPTHLMGYLQSHIQRALVQ